MTYHPILKWKCSFCKRSGETTHNLGSDCDERYTAVLEAHAISSPECAEKNGDRGIALDAYQGRLPEAS